MSKKNPTFVQAIALITLIFTVVLTGITVFHLDPHMPLFLAVTFVSAYAFYLGYGWEELEKYMFDAVASALQPMFIIMIIGMVVGGWIACGTVPYMIYWGVKMLSPKWFLLTSVILCSIMSMSLGSSWTTIGTIGVALMGVGAGLGIPAPMTAGAILTGAFFGDKQSPLSDTTNFAPAVAGTDLYSHVRSMLWTTVPGLGLSMVGFTFLGFRYGNGSIDQAQLDQFLTVLNNSFNMNVLLLIPIIVLIILIVRKTPAVLAMGIATLLGVVFAMALQGATFGEALTYIHYGYKSNTGVAMVDKLLSRGGLNSMMWTISLMMMALCMVGVLNKTNVLNVILEKISKAVSKPFGLITTTLLTCIGFSCVAPESNMAMVLPGTMFAPAYDRLGIDKSVLSRTLEDGTTLVAPMIPWHTGAVYSSVTLGVSTLSYFPFYFLGIITPIACIIMAFFNIGTFKATQKKASSALTATDTIDTQSA